MLLALPSVGLHTNGYSLARKLFFEVAGYDVDTHLDELGMTAGEALLQPHLSYLKPLDGLLDSGLIKGLAHITGGGLTDNIPANSAGRYCRGDRERQLARAAGFQTDAARSETFPKPRCIARSIWASGW